MAAVVFQFIINIMGRPRLGQSAQFYAWLGKLIRRIQSDQRYCISLEILVHYVNEQRSKISSVFSLQQN